MLKIAALLLLPGAILAANYGNNPYYNNPTNKPLEHNDESIKPDSNFVFNFEQLRRDQPAQVEMREERIGKYMYRRPVTTTQEPIVVPEINQNVPYRVPEKNVPQVSITPAPVNFGPQQWDSSPKQSITMAPPPPAPQWSDISKAFTNTKTFPHYESNLQDIAPQYNNHEQYYQTPRPHFSSIVTSKPASRGDLHINQNINMPSYPIQQRQHSPRQTNETPKAPNQNFGRNNIYHPLNEPIHTSPSEVVSHRVPTRNRGNDPKQPMLANRGSHKFSWNDVTNAPDAVLPTSTMAPVIQGRNPPQRPTLSPWLDGYGK